MVPSSKQVSFRRLLLVDAKQVLDDEKISISLSALGIGESGMLGIGFGGLSMIDAKVRREHRFFLTARAFVALVFIIFIFSPLPAMACTTLI